MNSANPLNLGWINAGIELTYVHPNERKGDYYNSFHDNILTSILLVNHQIQILEPNKKLELLNFDFSIVQAHGKNNIGT